MTPARPTRPSEAGTLYRCAACKAFKPAPQFNRDARQTNGIANSCRICRSAQVAKRRSGYKRPVVKVPENLDGPHTQDEVAAIFGVTRGAISKAENRALRKLRYAIMHDPTLRQMAVDSGVVSVA